MSLVANGADLLNIDDIPDFGADADPWGGMKRVTAAKWQGIRQRTIESGPIEQSMYIDLLTEIIHLCASPPPTPLEGVTEAPVASDKELELGLMHALAGKQVDCEGSTALMELVDEIMAALQ